MKKIFFFGLATMSLLISQAPTYAADLLEKEVCAEYIVLGEEFIDMTQAGNIERVKELLHQYDFLKDYQNDNGTTSLMMSIFWNQRAIMDVLLAAGVDVNKQDEDGATALTTASYYVRRMPIESIGKLLAVHADPNIKDNNGYTALMFACANGHHAIVEKLLAARANVHLKNQQNETALDMARKNDQTHLIDLLELHETMVLEDDDVMVKPAC